MYLAALMIVLVCLLIINVITLIVIRNKMDILTDMFIAIRKEYQGYDKQVDNIIDTMKRMAKAYVKLNEDYTSIVTRNNDIFMTLGEIQERYCDSYEQFEYCKNELDEIKEMLRMVIVEEDSENQNESNNDIKEEGAVA